MKIAHGWPSKKKCEVFKFLNHATKPPSNFSRRIEARSACLVHPMSTATPSNPDEPSKTPTKKATKSSKARKPKSAEPIAEETPVQEPVLPSFPVFDLSEVEQAPNDLSVPEETIPAADWPEPEEASSSQAPAPENHKRKRRRKKGKGGQSNGAQAPISEEHVTPLTQEFPTTPASAPRPLPPRPKLDQEMIAKLSWKIYLAEVSEEGVALIGDNDARELSRRCFRLAEIFIEEQSRRRL